jgi:chromosome segregation ATPase
LDQHPTESANSPRGKRRRKRAAKSDAAQAPVGPRDPHEFEHAGKPNESSGGGTVPPAHADETSGLNPAAGSEMEEGHFANVTASLVERGRADLASLLADSSKTELPKSLFLNSTAGPLVFKGEAKPSVIAAPPAAVASREGEAQENVQAKSRTFPPQAEHHADRAATDEELHRLQRELSALQATLADREDALAQAVSDLEQVRARLEQEKSGEAERVAQIEGQWQQKWAASLSEARAETDSAHDQAQREMATLQSEAATLRATLQERERALEAAASDHRQALKEAEAAHRKAEQSWKDAENARIAEAEAKRREQSESALSEMRAQAETARDAADEELRRLSDQLAALQGALADREKALAKAALEREQVRERAEEARNRADQEIRSLNGHLGRLRGTVADRDRALAKAASDTELLREQAEAARNRADQEIRSLNDQLTATRNTLADRETALAKAVLETKQVHEQAEASRKQAAEELRSLNDQLAATIADREAALAKAGRETERVRAQGREDLQAALAKAQAREAGEAARLAAAEAKWREQSGAALQEATARYQAAEGMLTQQRLQADRTRSDAVGGSIKPSGATFGAGGGSFGARVAHRETEHVQTPMPSRAELGLGTQDGKVVLRPNRIMVQQVDDRPRRRRAGRDVAAVAVLAAVVVVAYPTIQPLLPHDVRAAIGRAPGSAPSVSAPSSPAQRSALVTAEVNLRSGPSRNAGVITTLPRGMNVTVIDGRGDWMLVEVEGDARAGQRQGWVFGSFVQDAPELRSTALSARPD